jgi:hypothetical protein
MSIGNIWPWRHNLPIIPLCPWRHHSINMRPHWGRSLPFLMPDPRGVTCLLAIFGPGGTISPLYLYAPGGQHSINMRPLWGRSLFNHYIDHSFWNNNNFYNR